MNEAYGKLMLATLMPVAAAVLLWLLDKRTPFGRIDARVKQVIYGVIFGALAVVGTEWGIPLNGAQLNCRDAAVLVAGLMFGAPAGIIAGVIGGVERWIAVAWGIGTFTRVACTAATLFAGIYAAGLRKFMFEDKKPGVLISLAIGVVMEVLHLTLVFLTNMATPETAMNVVKVCSAPMIVANGVSVMLAALVLTLLSREHQNRKRGQTRISQTIQRWLLVTVVLAFAATSYFVFELQQRIADSQGDTLLSLALDETEADIRDTLAQGQDIHTRIVDLTRDRHVGKTGFVLILDEQMELVSAPAGLTREGLAQDAAGMEMPAAETTFEMSLNGEQTWCRYRVLEGYYLMATLPEDEALQVRNIALYVNTFMEILVFAILFGLIYLLIKRVVVDQIKSVNRSLARITGGHLDEVVNVRSNEEFASLSDDINTTVDTLKQYIDEASARIDAELEFAKNIQSSALPNVFPAFPKRKDIDIYAMMDPAKEVGGDFYDFYMTGTDMLHFLVADVSGKGIPAAMFMMRAKTELKSLTEAELPLCDVFTRGNTALCEGNDAGMFVTAWQGSLDMDTGLLRFANAGHNPPLVCHADGQFEFLRSRPGFVLAGMDGVRYQTQERQLLPGDTVYLYTDGVTEATNAQNELYGEERLLAALNARPFAGMQELCEAVKADVAAFVAEAPQFDDITMVALRYIGAPSITFERAAIADIPAVTAFAEAELEKIDCPMKTVIQINVAIDEIYSNIVKYGYKDGSGPVTVKLIVREDPRAVYIRFCDEGVPYNPLTKEDPDVTLSAEERNIGGLGIYMVKKTMDDMKYKYENGQNILTVMKRLE